MVPILVPSGKRIKGWAVTGRRDGMQDGSGDHVVDALVAGLLPR